MPVRILLLLAAGIAIFTAFGTAASANEGPYDLLVSSSANRSNAEGLDGATVDDDVYVFVSDEGDIATVEFFIDGSNSVFQTERHTPYDLSGSQSNGDAAAFDTDQLGGGDHSITARITTNDGTIETREADFEVSGSQQAPSPAPDPDRQLPADGSFIAVGAGELEEGVSSFPPTNVIDGDLSTRWASHGEDRNVFIDLGRVERVDDVGVAWSAGDERVSSFEIRAREGTSGDWDLVFQGESSGDGTGLEIYNVDDVDARFVRIKVFSNTGSDIQNIAEVRAFGIDRVKDGAGSDLAPQPQPDPAPSEPRGDFNLDPNRPPQDNFDLSVWALDTPAPRPGEDRSERINPFEYDDISDASREFFYTAPDGGLRFETRIDGARTSSGTSFVRSELRGMLRGQDTDVSTTGANANNWALGYQPSGGDYGGRNGTLEATLRINKVTTTGDGIHPGRTIIGQIHASDDEPLRLYYRKLPGHSHGCIYVSHEIRNGDDIDFDIIGNENCNDPSNGIELNELFSYEIENDGELLRVVIRRGDNNGPVIGLTTINMDELDSGYDRSDEWMYFKAGAYTQNNTGDGDDGDIITFYRLNVEHDRN